ncbi:MAG: DUF6062 family protein [Lachnospiraceae bacterium]|nr:DUF6062 family protein [Lachnospiraceae bacterium]
MKEQLYTIPVNEAFDSETECPICAMYDSLEQGALEFTLGPSYMEDDVRMVTDKIGFCERHIDMMYEKGNRLGLALMMKTHADRTIVEVENKKKTMKLPKISLFKKSEGSAENSVAAYLAELEKSCFVCDRINGVFDRYIDTIFYLYKSDSDFRSKFYASKGFCNKHLRLLINAAQNQLDEKEISDFNNRCVDLYLTNMKRVRDDLSWFIDKFDYRNQDAPWKDSKDAPKRMIMKQNSVFYDPNKKA